MNEEEKIEQVWPLFLVLVQLPSPIIPRPTSENFSKENVILSFSLSYLILFSCDGATRHFQHLLFSLTFYPSTQFIFHFQRIIDLSWQ